MSQYLVEFNRSYLDVYNLCASAFSVAEIAILSSVRLLLSLSLIINDEDRNTTVSHIHRQTFV